MTDLYAQMGIDATKGAVRATFEGGIRKDFPYAFVNIARTHTIPGYVRTLHGDGDGSKSIPRLLMYQLTKDLKWLKGMVDDAWSMNFGDIAAAGFVRGELMAIDSLHVNGFNVPKEAMLQAVKERVRELQKLYVRHGIEIDFMGGETADLPRQVQTSVFDVCAFGMMPEAGVVDGNVLPGDKIWGLASDGQAVWETEANSGIMSNGLTLATATLVHRDYMEKYPKLLLPGWTFEGNFVMNESPSILSGMTVAEALLSPTRQWALFIARLIVLLEEHDEFHLLHGISMNTGGGATKVSNVGKKDISFHKKMPEPPPVFRLIQRESGDSWHNMFKNFNCGVGLDVVGHRGLKPYVEAAANEYSIRLYELGECRDRSGDAPAVSLETPYGAFTY